VVFTETELNELLQDALAERPDVPVSSLSLRLEPDLIVVSADARAGFLTLNVEIDATLTIEEGRPIPEIVEIRAAGQPLTGFLRTQIDRMIAPYLEEWLQTDTSIFVEDVEIEEGQMRIVGRYE
jgi:hypothetical protein